MINPFVVVHVLSGKDSYQYGWNGDEAGADEVRLLTNTIVHSFVVFMFGSQLLYYFLFFFHTVIWYAAL